MSPVEALLAVLGAGATDLADVTARESAVTWACGDSAHTTGFAHVKTQLLIDMGFITAEDAAA
jgi:hypothetical protein